MTTRNRRAGDVTDARPRTSFRRETDAAGNQGRGDIVDDGTPSPSLPPFASESESLTMRSNRSPRSTFKQKERCIRYRTTGSLLYKNYSSNSMHALENYNWSKTDKLLHLRFLLTGDAASMLWSRHRYDDLQGSRQIVARKFLYHGQRRTISASTMYSA